MQGYLEPELNRLRAETVGLGRILEAAILDSVDLSQRHTSLGAHAKFTEAEPLITLDRHITKKRFTVEMDCLALIVANQPTHRDMWAVASILEIVTELEHIGHYVTDIGRVRFMLAKVGEPLSELVADVHEIAIRAQHMLNQALTAFERKDCDLARDIYGADQKVRELYREFFQRVLFFMRGKSRTTIKQARYLAQIARNLVRTADRVTNICEWLVFSATGELGPMGRETMNLVQEELI
jgi:phosphate transport system protein